MQCKCVLDEREYRGYPSEQGTDHIASGRHWGTEDAYQRPRSYGYGRNYGSEGRYYRKSNQQDLRASLSREEEMEEKTKLMIIKVGDKVGWVLMLILQNTSQLNSNLESLSGLIEKEYGQQKDAILKAFQAW
jgi:hypothetical protein